MPLGKGTRKKRVRRVTLSLAAEPIHWRLSYRTEKGCQDAPPIPLPPADGRVTLRPCLGGCRRMSLLAEGLGRPGSGAWPWRRTYIAENRGNAFEQTGGETDGWPAGGDETEAPEPADRRTAGGAAREGLPGKTGGPVPKRGEGVKEDG